MKAGLYARVSTDAQLEGYSIDAQKEFLLSFAKSKEYTEFEFYIDGGYSGKDLNRPEIQRLIEDVKLNKIDTVIVFKLDRISRSQKDTLYLIEEIFNKYDVGFISMRENFDTTSPFGKAMIGILSVFAQLERETILERTRIGIKKRAESGYWRGGGKVPFPYDYDKTKGILVPNKHKVKIFKKMVSMYLNGKSFNKIAQIVDMDERQVETRLLSVTNTGKIPYKGEIYDGLHEAVISDELYNEILEINKRRGREKYQKHYLLSGKIICSHCKAKYRYQKWGKRTIIYCYSQQKSKIKYIKDPNCKNQKWDSYKIENIILDNIFKMNLDNSLIKNNYNIVNVDIKGEFESRIKRINKQIDNLVLALSKGIAVNETSKKIKSLEKERIKIEQQINFNNTIENKKNISCKMVKSLQSIWNYMTFDEKRSLIDYIIDYIEIDNNNVTIYYKIF